jgi:hypothetical protein
MVFVVAEAPGEGQRVAGEGSGAGIVVGDALGDRAVVVVADGGQRLGVQGGLPGGAGGLRVALLRWFIPINIISGNVRYPSRCSTDRSFQLRGSRVR